MTLMSMAIFFLTSLKLSFIVLTGNYVMAMFSTQYPRLLILQCSLLSFTYLKFFNVFLLDSIGMPTAQAFLTSWENLFKRKQPRVLLIGFCITVGKFGLKATVSLFASQHKYKLPKSVSLRTSLIFHLLILKNDVTIHISISDSIPSNLILLI